MKTTTKNSRILFCVFCIIGILLISGCIGEKPEENESKILELEEKEAELNKKEAELNKKEAELEEKEAELNKNEAELEEKEAELNKTGSEIKELEEESVWCEETAAKKYSAGSKTMWIEGVVEFKEKQMCHLRDFSISANETTQYDWYFTENEEEVYRVITYPDGRVEETQVI